MHVFVLQASVAEEGLGLLDWWSGQQGEELAEAMEEYAQQE
jgi:hypothetical protein